MLALLAFVPPRYLLTAALLLSAGVAGLRLSLSKMVERSTLSFLPAILAGGFLSSLFVGLVLPMF